MLGFDLSSAREFECASSRGNFDYVICRDEIDTYRNPTDFFVHLVHQHAGGNPVIQHATFIFTAPTPLYSITL